MFVRVQVEQKKPGKRGPPKTFAFLRCDICGVEFSRTFKGEKMMRQQFHFHSRECMNSASMKGGVLADKKIATNIKNLGVAHPQQSDIVKERTKITCIDRYGVSSPMKNMSIRQRALETNVERYGAAELFTSDVIKERIRQTWLAKYSVDHHMKSDEGKERVQHAFMAKYGVDNAMKIDSVKAKFPFKESALKAHETKKKNGTYATSKVEQRFYRHLLQAFAADDIERPMLVNGWSVDFYVKSISTYIQLDGVYWHGLDRPIDKIMKLEHGRDQTILYAFERDRQQDVWFAENKIRLIRVTDREFSLAMKSGSQLLIERIRG